MLRKGPEPNPAPRVWIQQERQPGSTVARSKSLCSVGAINDRDSPQESLWLMGNTIPQAAVPQVVPRG